MGSNGWQQLQPLSSRVVVQALKGVMHNIFLCFIAGWRYLPVARLESDRPQRMAWRMALLVSLWFVKKLRPGVFCAELPRISTPIDLG